MKIYDFLDWYNLYEESIFKIKEINKFIWWDEIKFNIILEFKNNI
jgi:hypothetical protein